jgi:enoyl-CoA hydratase
MAAESAVIGLPEVSLGLLPGWGGTVRCVRLFGPAVARRIILSGELFSAEKALRLGLVDSVATDGDFPAAVEARVEQLLSRGPAACRAVKRLISQFNAEDGIDNEFEAEARAFAQCYATAEPAEGLTAFLEKRPPRWPSGA